MTQASQAPLLDAIEEPQQLRQMSRSELKELANAARNRIISVLSQIGGHLASNLGTVEMTIALHYCFEAPYDKLIWDVSHQTYTHKLLTGRNERFPFIRQYNGLCGFSNPQESVYDHFYAGHAGTALSLAIGVAARRDLCQENFRVIPIIGDATLTCGMSLEALNNISKSLGRFIIILNDNAMSISKNVGAIRHILSRILSNPTTFSFQRELDHLISKIPSCGPFLSRQTYKISSSIKHLVSPAVFFEQYGISYIGPIDGHDIDKMIDTFEKIKDTKMPVLIHLLTNKGQGMPAALENPDTYHGARPFHLDSGSFISKKGASFTFAQLFGQIILEMAEEDPSIVAVTPAMTLGSCLEPMIKRFPLRCFDVGIAEGHCITFSGGLAYEQKLKVVTSIYSTFLQRAFDNLFHDVCLQRISLLVAIDRAFLSGPDGSTHHGIYDIAFLNAMPAIVICQPRDGQLLYELMHSAFNWRAVVALRYPNLPTPSYTPQRAEMRQSRTLGKSEVIAKGKQLLIIGLGHMCTTALAVRLLLASQSQVIATVLDPIFVKPLDEENLLELFKSHSYVVTIEEHAVNSGLGAIINHFIMRKAVQGLRVLNIGIEDEFIEQGCHEKLMEHLGMTPNQICQRITDWMGLSC